jgi:hypothetical protein
MSKIHDAFISQAKTLLPSVIKKARNEALRGTGKKVAAEKEILTSNPANRKGKEQSRSSSSDKGAIPKGMTSLEFLMKE